MIITPPFEIIGKINVLFSYLQEAVVIFTFCRRLCRRRVAATVTIWGHLRVVGACDVNVTVEKVQQIYNKHLSKSTVVPC